MKLNFNPGLSDPRSHTGTHSQYGSQKPLQYASLVSFK